MDNSSLITTYTPIDQEYVNLHRNSLETLQGIRKVQDDEIKKGNQDIENLLTYRQNKQSFEPLKIPQIQIPDTDMSVNDFLKSQGIHFKLSSGYRPGAVTNTGHKSNHSKKDAQGNPLAIDIIPEAGYTFKDLASEIYGNQKVINFLKSKGYGIIEEVSPSEQKKYGASGANWHIGPDQAALINFNNRIRSAEDGMKFDDSDLYTEYKTIKPSTTTSSLDILKQIQSDNEPETTEDLQTVSNIDQKPKQPLNLIINKLSKPEPEEPQQSDTNFDTAYDKVEQLDPEAKKYRKLLTHIAYMESRFNPKAKNSRLPAYGYFQLMQGDKWNNITRYAGTSTTTFLNNPVLQIQAAINLAKAFEKQFSSKDLQQAKSKGITMNGLIGGAWLGGLGGVRAYLNNGQNRSDGGTTVAARINATNFV